MTGSRLPVLLLVAAALALGPATAAEADGDPASDVLLSQDVFYPYAPNAVPAADKAALNAMAVQAARKGFRLKIALIAASSDLGSVFQLFTRPQTYADLLTRELPPGTARVLVVLPSGIGGNHLGDNAGPALKDITVDAAGGSSGLAKTAMRAVGAITRAAGRPVPVPAVAREAPTRSNGGGSSPLLVFGLPVLLVLVAAAIAAARGRGRDQDADADHDTMRPAT